MAEHVKNIVRQQALEKTIASENSFKAKKMNYIDIMRKTVEFVWKIYVEKTTNEILECIKTMMEEKGTQPSHFQDRIIFMSMYNDTVYWKRMTRTSVGTKQHGSHSTHRTSNQDIGHLFGLENERFGSLTNKPDGEWNSTAEHMMQEFAESGYPVFRCSFQLSSGVLKRWNEKDSNHHDAEPNSAEMLMKTIVSVSQFSMHMAVLNWYLENEAKYIMFLQTPT